MQLPRLERGLRRPCSFCCFLEAITQGSILASWSMRGPGEENEVPHPQVSIALTARCVNEGVSALPAPCPKPPVECICAEPKEARKGFFQATQRILINSKSLLYSSTKLWSGLFFSKIRLLQRSLNKVQ